MTEESQMGDTERIARKSAKTIADNDSHAAKKTIRHN